LRAARPHAAGLDGCAIPSQLLGAIALSKHREHRQER
jgi:hypothetical protein